MIGKSVKDLINLGKVRIFENLWLWQSRKYAHSAEKENRYFQER